MAGDFTPGAELEEWQIEAIMSFVTCKGKTDDETLENMRRWFKKDWKKDNKENAP